LPDHRPRGRLGADVDGHDDAAAGGGVAAVQADLLRAGRRLVAGGGKPGAELRRIAGGAWRRSHRGIATIIERLHQGTALPYDAPERIRGPRPCNNHSTAPPKISATRSISNTSTSRCPTSGWRPCSMSLVSG